MPVLENVSDRAYLAGLFDGEGYVGVEREFRKDRNKVRHRTVLAVSNTDERVVREFKAAVGHGWIVKLDRKAEWKPLYIWKVKGGSARFVLEQIVEFLRVKRPQAELALEGPDTEEKWTAIKALNKRGREVAVATD